MEKLFILCHTWSDINMTIKVFFTEDEALDYVSELISDVFREPSGLETLKEYLRLYSEYMEDVGIELSWVIKSKELLITTNIEFSSGD